MRPVISHTPGVAAGGAVLMIRLWRAVWLLAPLAACRQIGDVHDDVLVAPAAGGASGTSSGASGTTASAGQGDRAGAAGTASGGGEGGGGGGGGGGAGVGCPVAAHGPTLVWVEGVCVDRTEVSSAQFDEFANDIGYQPPAGLSYGSCVTNPALRHQRVSGDAPALPARGVTHCGAKAYCHWAGKHLCGAIGGGVTSPSTTSSPLVDEWTRGCMGGTAPRSYPYGGGTMSQPRVCNDDQYFTAPMSCKDSGACAPEPVDAPTSCKNTQGVVRMLGNAFEWSDACDEGASPPTCELRGGGFAEFHSDVSCYLARPQPFGESNPDIGFRCCANPL